MHHGSINNPKTKAGHLYNILCGFANVPIDAWHLAMEIKTTCIGTVVAEVRAQLPTSESLICERRGKNHFYKLVRASRFHDE